MSGLYTTPPIVSPRFCPFLRALGKGFRPFNLYRLAQEFLASFRVLPIIELGVLSN